MDKEFTSDEVIDGAIKKARFYLYDIKRRKWSKQLTMFDHCYNVYKQFSNCSCPGENYETTVTAALLHDILEDSPCTMQELLDIGVSDDAITVIKLLTKRDDQNYDDYLKAIKQNSIATKIKIADMLNNLGDTPTQKQVKKYIKGLSYLMIDEVK